MAVTTRTECTPKKWTIDSLCTEKEATRQQWETDLAANMGKVANAIAESIARKVFLEIPEWLSNPYQEFSCSLSRSYSLDLPTNAAEIKKWMGNTAYLPPFNDWFCAFENQKAIDNSYLQKFMAPIGDQVSSLIEARINTFAQESGNGRLHASAEWQGRILERGIFTTFSSTNNNSVNVTLSLQDPAPQPPAINAQETEEYTWLKRMQAMLS